MPGTAEYTAWEQQEEEHPFGVDFDDVAEDASPSSWRPVDLVAVLDGPGEPTPSILSRDDGQKLIYPRKIHTFSGESESLKSWFALIGCAEEINAGRHALYIDLEDDAATSVGRLTALGVPRDAILNRFHYVSPTEPFTDRARKELADAFGDTRPSLSILDGVAEAMALHGLDPNKNPEIAAFYTRLPKKLTTAGCAVGMVDHVAKARDGNRYQTGGAHKLNALDGVAYVFDLARPFGRGLHGIAKVYVAKDRPGHIRAAAGPPRADRTQLVCELHLRSEADGSIFAELHPPIAREPGEVWRPTVLMARVTDVLTKAGRPLTKQEIEARCRGKRVADVRAAIAVLEDEGYLKVEQGPRNAHLHTLLRPFTEADS